jgi:hypothetical protein
VVDDTIANREISEEGDDAQREKRSDVTILLFFA